MPTEQRKKIFQYMLEQTDRFVSVTPIAKIIFAQWRSNSGRDALTADTLSPERMRNWPALTDGERDLVRFQAAYGHVGRIAHEIGQLAIGSGRSDWATVFFDLSDSHALHA